MTAMRWWDRINGTLTLMVPREAGGWEIPATSFGYGEIVFELITEGKSIIKGTFSVFYGTLLFGGIEYHKLTAQTSPKVSRTNI